ncbi:hypothetical protein [Arthrobacter sp. SX1312]|nr:hypothetical protein [Arthrobacter sp. SX1312]
MSETPGDDDRIHSEAPAEGDTAADPADIRVHAEDPAEGADSEDKDSDGT